MWRSVLGLSSLDVSRFASRVCRNVVVCARKSGIKDSLRCAAPPGGASGRRSGRADAASNVAFAYRDEEAQGTWPLGRERGGGAGDDSAWPWLGVAVCSLTGDVAVADTDFNEIILL